MLPVGIVGIGIDLVSIPDFAEQVDRGRIIGKSGRMISSLRTLVQAAGEKHGLLVNLELFDEDETDRPRRSRADPRTNLRKRHRPAPVDRIAPTS